MHLITPEEHAALVDQGKDHLLKALEEGNLVAEAWLASWRRGPLQEEAENQAAQIRQEVAAAPPEQGTLFQWCGFPTDLTRVSPFYPMNPKELGRREFLQDHLITSANWGEIRYTGPKLSTYEEDALLALLAILEHQSQYRRPVFLYEAKTEYDLEGGYKEKTHTTDQPIAGITRKTYSYTGPLLPLWRLMYGDTTKSGQPKKPNRQDYKRLVSALKRLTVAGVELAIAARTKTGKRNTRYTSMSSMLSNVFWDEEKKLLSVTINPFFYETYYAATVTLMDVQRRMALSGGIAKSLYRFIQSHQKPEWTGHFLTLAAALNMDRDQPAKTMRKRLKEAISELIKHGILTKQSRMMKQDIVTLTRAQGALPAPARRKKKLNK